VRLVDFLILLLSAHAETLKRLAAFFGEENLVNLLEVAGEETEGALPPTKVARERAPIIWIDEPTPRSNACAYAELEGNVREFDLPEVLEFHLWAYPPYRTYIESAVNLGASLPPGGGETGVALVEEACHQAEEWVRTLGIPPAVAPAAYKAAQVPWLRFRTEALKKMGRRPLGAVPQ
jgi:hypothetical protein